MMLSGSLQTVLIPAHAAPPAVLMRAVCRSGGGWCCPLSPVAMDAGGVGKKTQDSHLLEELPISPAPNRQDPAECQWGAVLAGALR